jgi:outer membrane receptor protein involved in Fe transport
MAVRQGAVFLGVVLCVLASVSVRAQITVYDVAAQPLETALVEFAEEAGLSIDYSGLRLDGLRSAGTRGHVSREVSLRAILAGSGIAFRFLDDRTVRLFRPRPKAALRPRPAEGKEDGATKAGYIEDLVVTAAKRPAVGFELPVSVSGISSLALADLDTYDLQSLAPHLAGVSTTNLGPGRNKIFIRGLSDGPFADRTQAMVGVYIDEGPVNLNDTNPDLRLFDVERVEVVRGPQGTLYGAGSLGGLYRIITAKPDLQESSARARATVSSTRGGGIGNQLDFVVNFPLLKDRLGLRLTGYGEHREGYIDNIRLDENNVNDLDIYGVRPAIRWQPADNWIIDASANFQAIHYDDSQYFDARLPRNKRANVLREPYDDDFVQANLTVQGRVGALQLSSATAYIDRIVRETADASEGLQFFDELAMLPPEAFIMEDVSDFTGAEEFLEEAQPADAVAYFTRNEIHTFSHETRLQSDAGRRFDWLAGFYFLHRWQTKDRALALAFDIEDARLALREERTETMNDAALFGEVIFRPTEKLSLTAGARLSHSSQDLEYMSEFVLNDGLESVEGQKSNTKFIPKLALRYAWSDNLQTYAQVSVGYRVGGLNINTPPEALPANDGDDTSSPTEQNRAFSSDDLVNYEIGIKSFWFDRKVSLNASVFYVRWFDIQSDQIGDNGLPFVTNVGDASNLGYEMEFSVSPFAGLELKGSVFWNDSELMEDNAYLGASEGDKLPAIAESAASVALLYQFSLSPEWDATISADYAFTGSSSLTFNEENSPKMGNYGILNTRLQVSNDVWKIGLFAQNLTDTQANTFSYGNGFTVLDGQQVTPPRPRTIGLFIERRF